MEAEEILEEAAVERDNSRWTINIAWLEEQGRAFPTMVERCLCTKCRKRLKSLGDAVVTEGIIDAARECGEHSKGYITGDMPIMESIFRLLLAGGNQPLDLIELGQRLSERRGVDTYRTSVGMLLRLLRNDRYYGIQQV